MMEIEEAKHYLRLCELASDWDNFKLWLGYAHELCGDCCPECTTPSVLRSVYRLYDYNERGTIKDIDIELKFSVGIEWRKDRLIDAKKTLLKQLEQNNKGGY